MIRSSSIGFGHWVGILVDCCWGSDHDDILGNVSFGRSPVPLTTLLKSSSGEGDLQIKISFIDSLLGLSPVSEDLIKLQKDFFFATISEIIS